MRKLQKKIKRKLKKLQKKTNRKLRKISRLIRQLGRMNQKTISTFYKEDESEKPIVKTTKTGNVVINKIKI